MTLADKDQSNIDLGGVIVTRDAKHIQEDAWYRGLRVCSPDGYGPEEFVPYEDISDERKLKQYLARKGLRQLAGRAACSKLLREAREAAPSTSCRLTSALGWHQDAYVLPHLSIGGADEGEILFRQSARPHTSAQSGTLQGWVEHVAVPAAASSLGVFLICAALAPVLMRFAGVESCIFHISGRSGVGKTTMAKLAASVWRGGPNAVDSWNMTSGGFEDLMVLRNDGFACLDEITVAESNRKDLRQLIQQVSYKTTAGITRRRSVAYDGGAQSAYRLFGVSTGELSAKEITKAVGETRMLGETARFLDLVIDQEAGGVFDRLGAPEPAATGESAAKVADGINAAVEQYFGTAAEAFIRVIVADIETAEAKVKAHVEAFLRMVYVKDTGLHRRVARKFALAYAAGQIGIEAGILPWTQALMTEAVVRSYESACAHFLSPEDRLEQAFDALKRLLSKENRADLRHVKSGKVIAAMKGKSSFLANRNGKPCAYVRTAEINKIATREIRRELLQRLRDAGLFEAPPDFPRKSGFQLRLPGTKTRAYYSIFRVGIMKFKLT